MTVETIAKTIITDDRLMFSGLGYFCVFEKNPIAPGWRMWDWDTWDGVHIATPLSHLWRLIDTHIECAKAGDRGKNEQESKLILEKLLEIKRCPEHDFYRGLKLSEEDRSYFWELGRGKIREESKM